MHASTPGKARATVVHCATFSTQRVHGPRLKGCDIVLPLRLSRFSVSDCLNLGTQHSSIAETEKCRPEWSGAVVRALRFDPDTFPCLQSSARFSSLGLIIRSTLRAHIGRRATGALSYGVTGSLWLTVTTNPCFGWPSESSSLSSR